VLAARFAAAKSWGDRGVRRLFSASGSDAQPGGFTFGSDAIGLIRGVDTGDIAGTHAAVANVDYRVPLMRLEHGAGTLPLFARTLHGALFADAGHAWETDFRRRDVQVSLGGEISLDAVIGYSLPLTLTTGGAWASNGRGFVAFGRVGRAF
jgi:outer membrane protein assembly factor BamA